MFEKEAEEYAKRSCFTEYPNPSLSEDIDISDEIKEAVLYGYNKANKWHYPSRGEYPDENGEYLFLVKAFSNVHRVVGDYEVLKNQRLWYAEIADHCIEDEPIAWQYLPDLPPKEEYTY